MLYDHLNDCVYDTPVHLSHINVTELSMHCSDFDLPSKTVHLAQPSFHTEKVLFIFILNTT